MRPADSQICFLGFSSTWMTKATSVCRELIIFNPITFYLSVWASRESIDLSDQKCLLVPPDKRTSVNVEPWHPLPRLFIPVIPVSRTVLGSQNRWVQVRRTVCLKFLVRGMLSEELWGKNESLSNCLVLKCSHSNYLDVFTMHNLTITKLQGYSKWFGYLNVFCFVMHILIHLL